MTEGQKQVTTEVSDPIDLVFTAFQSALTRARNKDRITTENAEKVLEEAKTIFNNVLISKDADENGFAVDLTGDEELTALPLPGLKQMEKNDFDAFIAEIEAMINPQKVTN